MSNRQTKERILEYISNFSETHGISPTISEITDGVGLKSRSSVHGHINRLSAAGRLSFDRKSARSIRLKPRVILDESDRKRHRIRIELSDGGVIFLDCSLEKGENESFAVSFLGVLDVSGIKGKIGHVVNCRIVESQ